MSPIEHYYRFSKELRDLFGCRVQKIPLHAGFSCPNRDGTISPAGCIFCDNRAFSSLERIGTVKLNLQLDRGIEWARRRFGARKFIAYFQTFTNTHASLEKLKETYDVVLPYEEVVGLSIGTRPDCVSEDILELIGSYARTRTVWIEYGLQSVHDRSLHFLNRGHTFRDFLSALESTKAHHLRVCVHVILGLPGESDADMIETADRLGRLPIDSIKIHCLQVIKGTALEKMYGEGRFSLPELDTYVRMVTSFLERLPGNISIQRITTDTNPRYLVAPLWLHEKQEILDAVDRQFAHRGTCQGSLAAASRAPQFFPGKLRDNDFTAER